MKRRNKWFRQGTVVTAVAASVFGGLGMNREASADRASVPVELEDQYAKQVVAAEAKADGGQFEASLRISEGIPVNSKHYNRVLQKQEMWGRLLLQQARDASQRGEVQKATALVRPLLNRPTLAPEVQRLSAQWQQQAELMAQVEQAQTQEDWQGVMASIETIRATDTTLANTPKLQAISQVATMKAYGSPEVATADAFTAKAITTPASHIEIIGQDSAPSPIMLQVGSTAIDISTVTKATRSDKPTAIVTPHPVPVRVAGASSNVVRSASPAKSPKLITIVNQPSEEVSTPETDAGSVSPIANAPAPPLVESITTESISAEPASNAASMPAVPAESDITIEPMNPSLVVETVPSLEEITESPASLTVVGTETSLPFRTIQKDIQQKPSYPSIKQ